MLNTTPKNKELTPVTENNQGQRETDLRPVSKKSIARTEPHDRGAVLGDLYRYILSDKWGVKHESAS